MKNKNILISLFLPLVIGLALFSVIIGWGITNPGNLAWIVSGDPAQQYLGWAFFRNTPWTFPIGLNPNYGLDISSSIVYSDSIPLFAFIFKIFSAWLPEPFQYLGIWTLLCFILQGYFAWLLMGLITRDILIRSIGIAYFLASPAMLWRVGFHSNITCHYLLLAALYLCLKQDKKNANYIKWAAILVLGLLSNFYIFLMLFILFIAATCDRNYFLCLSVSDLFKKNFKYYFLIGLILIMVCWVSGYFIIHSHALVASRYGEARMNVLSPINPSGWSHLFPDLYVTDSMYEGYNYLGAGIGALAIAALYRIYKCNLSTVMWHKVKHYKYLALGLIALTLIAISSNLSIGMWNIEIPLPSWLNSILSIFRSSGRMFWPVYYALMLTIFYLVIRGYSRKSAILILSVGLLIQIADTSAGWWPMREKLNRTTSSQFETPLKDSFWGAAAGRYSVVITHLRRQNKGFIPNDWMPFASFAAINHLSTNSAYLSRVDDSKLIKSNERFDGQMRSGNYDPKSLYIVEDAKIIPVLMHLDVKTDLFARIDGFNVLAPGWLACKECPVVSKDAWIHQSFEPTIQGKSISFGKGQSGANYLVEVGQAERFNRGWGWPEVWGTWSDGTSATVTLPMPKEGASSLEINANAFVTPRHPKQMIDLWVNGISQGKIELIKSENNMINIKLSEATQKAGYVQVEFVFLNPVKPKDIGVGDDARLVTLGIKTAVFR